MPATPRVRVTALFELIRSGGPLMIPIILCSIASLAICIERWSALKLDRVVPRGTLAEVWEWIRRDDLGPQRMRSLRAGSPLGRVLSAGLANAHHGREVMKESIEEEAGHVIHELERYLDALGTIASIAPLLGLLGTVVGMIQVFTQVMLHGTGDAGLLAGGISTAMVTTAAGLCVAIPTIIAHRHFLRRVDSIVVALEKEAIRLVDALHGGRAVETRNP